MESIKDTVTESQINYKKGADFEMEFADFMKNSLNYNSVKVRKHMPGKNTKGAEADIIGIIHDHRGEKFRKLSLVTILFSIVGTFATVFGAFKLEMAAFFIVTSFGAILYAALGRRFSDKYTWVECKNLKSKVDYEKVSALLRKVKENNDSKNKLHYIDNIIYVSANGFVDNAEVFARDNNIKCYMKKGNEFIESEYWH